LIIKTHHRFQLILSEKCDNVYIELTNYILGTALITITGKF